MKDFISILIGVYVATVWLIFAVAVVLFGPFWLMLLTGSGWALLGFFISVPLFVALCIYCNEKWG